MKATRKTTDTQKLIAKNLKQILKAVGENTSREGLLETPKRYAVALDYLTSGYSKNVDQIIGNALFKAEDNGIIIVRDIELFSLCEHHMLPFYGKAHIAYIPTDKIIGLSKIPRIVDVYARRLQVQERLTRQIAEELKRTIQPMGVAVIIEAFHLCMMMRGVEKQNSYTITSSMHGVFMDDATARKELMQLLGGLGSTMPRR